jgi:hypothetical protein
MTGRQPISHTLGTPRRLAPALLVLTLLGLVALWPPFKYAQPLVSPARLPPQWLASDLDRPGCKDLHVEAAFWLSMHPRAKEVSSSLLAAATEDSLPGVRRLALLALSNGGYTGSMSRTQFLRFLETRAHTDPSPRVRETAQNEALGFDDKTQNHKTDRTVRRSVPPPAQGL